jgi:hypothetical protein
MDDAGAVLGNLTEQLGEWHGGDSLEILRMIVELGDAGASLIVTELNRRSDRYERLYLVAALGDTAGRGGVDTLRQCLRTTGSGNRDLRCAALVALCKKLGSDANADLKYGLEDKDRTLQRYSIEGLAVFGNGELWDLVFDRWSWWMVHPLKRDAGKGSEEVLGFCYLVKHVETPARRSLLQEGLASLLPRSSVWVQRNLSNLIGRTQVNAEVPLPSVALAEQWIHKEAAPLFEVGNVF